MSLPKQVSIAFALGIVFLCIHILIASLKLNDVFTLVFTMAAMLLVQITAYKILSNYKKGTSITFGRVVYTLSLTQVFCVILLSLNSAYNPYVDTKPINFLEVFFSLLVFAGVLPFIIAALLWFVRIKQRNTSFK